MERETHYSIWKERKNPAKVLTRHWLSENINLGFTFTVAHLAREGITAVQLKKQLQIRNYYVCLLHTYITRQFQSAMKSSEAQTAFPSVMDYVLRYSHPSIPKGWSQLQIQLRSLTTWAKCLIFCVSWTTASTTELSRAAAHRQREQLAGAGGLCSPNTGELP